MLDDHARAARSETGPVAPSAAPNARPVGGRRRLSLTQQIMLGLVLGALLGALVPQSAKWMELPRDIFLHLIKVMIAPLIFASVVQGFAGGGDLKKVGRIGIKALIYFEIVTTIALAIGLLVVNLAQPGAGVTLTGSAAELGTAAQRRPLTLSETLLHAFPTSLLDAMARNDVLQIVVFSVLFAIAVIAAGEKGKPLLAWCESLSLVMFKFADLVMLVAPIGVAAALAVTVGHQGFAVLLTLGKLVLTLYAGLVVLVVVVFGLVLWLARIPLIPFLRATRDPFALAFSTASSEAALPKALDRMEQFGVPRGIAGFVLPAGCTFNLAGSTLHLGVATVFIAQMAESTTGHHFGLAEQLMLLVTLKITSKGVAAVPRASLVVLIAALQSFNLPLAGAAMILGVDAILDMARTSVNLLGNCLASVVVARWEGEFKPRESIAAKA